MSPCAGVALLLALLGAAPAGATVFADVGIESATDDNVSRSEKSDDIEQDRFAQATVRVGDAFEVGTGTSLAVNASVRAVEFRRFRDLSEVAGGAASVWTDFRVHADGYGRIVLHDRGLGERQAGQIGRAHV